MSGESDRFIGCWIKEEKAPVEGSEISVELEVACKVFVLVREFVVFHRYAAGREIGMRMVISDRHCTFGTTMIWLELAHVTVFP